MMASLLFLLMAFCFNQCPGSVELQSWPQKDTRRQALIVWSLVKALWSRVEFSQTFKGAPIVIYYSSRRWRQLSWIAERGREFPDTRIHLFDISLVLSLCQTLLGLNDKPRSSTVLECVLSLLLSVRILLFSWLSGLNNSPKFGNNSIRIRNQVLFLGARICSFLLCWVQNNIFQAKKSFNCMTPILSGWLEDQG